jgi:hypothetical protein
MRPEPLGKATLLGYLGVLPNVSFNVANLKIPVKLLTMIFSLSKGQGDFEIVPKLLDPSQTNLLPNEDPIKISLSPDYGINFAVSLQNVTFKQRGLYTSQILCGAEVLFAESFVVGEGSGPPPPPLETSR